jgi:hypothetical protein
MAGGWAGGEVGLRQFVEVRQQKQPLLHPPAKKNGPCSVYPTRLIAESSSGLRERRAPASSNLDSSSFVDDQEHTQV